jgi:hypothetical protein
VALSCLGTWKEDVYSAPEGCGKELKKVLLFIENCFKSPNFIFK